MQWKWYCVGLVGVPWGAGEASEAYSWQVRTGETQVAASVGHKARACGGGGGGAEELEEGATDHWWSVSLQVRKFGVGRSRARRERKADWLHVPCECRVEEG